MKRTPLILTFVLAGLVLTSWFFWPRKKGYATPKECLDAFYEAALAGEVEPYLDCLAPPLRAEMEGRFPDRPRFRDHLLHSTRNLKTLVYPAEPVIEGNAVQIEIDEVSPGRRKRLTYRLEKEGGGWCIVAIGPARDLPELIPYNTHVKERPEGP